MSCLISCSCARSFDTYFYAAALADPVSHFVSGASGSAGASPGSSSAALALDEVTSSLWATPGEALDLSRAGLIAFAPPTTYVLTQLASAPTLAAAVAALSAASRASRGPGGGGATTAKPFYPYHATQVAVKPAAGEGGVARPAPLAPLYTASPCGAPAPGVAGASASAAAPSTASAAAGAAASGAAAAPGGESAKRPAAPVRYVVLPGDHEHPDSIAAAAATAAPAVALASGSGAFASGEMAPFLPLLASRTVRTSATATAADDARAGAEGTVGAIGVTGVTGVAGVIMAPLHRLVPVGNGCAWEVVVTDPAAVAESLLHAKV